MLTILAIDVDNLKIECEVGTHILMSADIIITEEVHSKPTEIIFPHVFFVENNKRVYIAGVEYENGAPEYLSPTSRLYQAFVITYIRTHSVIMYPLTGLKWFIENMDQVALLEFAIMREFKDFLQKEIRICIAVRPSSVEPYKLVALIPSSTNLH